LMQFYGRRSAKKIRTSEGISKKLLDKGLTTYNPIKNCLTRHLLR
jgi:hypothetical protein